MILYFLLTLYNAVLSVYYWFGFIQELWKIGVLLVVL